MIAFPPKSYRPWRLLVLAIAVIGWPAGCSGDSSTCAGPETVHLKMSGTCASGPREFDLRNVDCRLAVTGADLGIPSAGAVAERGDVIRRGEWQLFGCANGASEPCPDRFRLCTTKRVAWQLDMACLDGAGNIACQAVLTE